VVKSEHQHLKDSNPLSCGLNSYQAIAERVDLYAFGQPVDQNHKANLGREL
jgi:hypothetical protein